jgi:ribonuclease HI
MMLVMWRIWHNHNEITHDKPCPSIVGSRRFLVSHLNTILTIKQYPHADMEKGKMVVDHLAGFHRKQSTEEERRCSRKKWCAPPQGQAKLNVNGAFSPSGGAGIGMLLWDHQGDVIMVACRTLQECRDATEAELCAVEDGVKLALQWTQLPVIVETDCSEVLELLNEGTPNSSVHAFRISAIRELLRERNFSIVKMSRDVNMASHELARLGRVHKRTHVWLMDFPQEISEVITSDCNPSFV